MRRPITPGTRQFSISTRGMRRILSWKFVFYELLLPALRGLGPARGDAILGFLGWLAMVMRPRRARKMRAVARASQRGPRRGLVDRDDLAGAGGQHGAVPRARLPARPPEQRRSLGPVRRARLRATACHAFRWPGAILVGSHLGAHIAGVHWLFRRGLPLRLLVQRPRHVSSELNHRFDAGGIHPQVEMFLRRDLSPAVAVERVFRARCALRDGLAIYLNGDIPWSGPNTCPGMLLGRPQRLLAIWTELAVLTGTPVFLVFCTHLPGGRFALEIEAIGHLRPGEEETAVADYLKQLEARIATCPADAVAHLSWPCYESPLVPYKQVRKRTAVGSSRPLLNRRG